MSQSLRRVITKVGKEELLGKIFQEEGPGIFFGQKLYFVTEVTVNPVDDALTAVTLAGDGLSAGITLTAGGDVRTSSSGKVCRVSAVVTGAMLIGVAPITVIGVMIGPSNNPAQARFFTEFDEPMTLDETADEITLCMELGFDGQQMYVVPRVLPIGQ